MEIAAHWAHFTKHNYQVAGSDSLLVRDLEVSRQILLLHMSLHVSREAPRRAPPDEYAGELPLRDSPRSSESMPVTWFVGHATL